MDLGDTGDQIKVLVSGTEDQINKALKKSTYTAASTSKVHRVQLTPHGGKLTVDGPYEEELVVAFGNILSLSGTEDQINKALKNLIYTAPTI